ncbi:MAG TPA: DUF2339 domain-containing protein [Syntrophomonadaceae bacterium]|nr:DUF2339 domain-containing protein [Syntrophomonadaceae bacterium]
MEDQDQLQKLAQELESVKTRLSALEASCARLEPGTNKAVISPPRVAGARPPESDASPSASSTKEPFFRDGLESLIGKRLLNRVGIIVLFFAVAYFLKYSFDNGWIGPRGQVAIGYVIGAAFLLCGDLLIRKGYRYFAQGVSGGGIAIIYLSTVAAVSLYHLLPSYTAFLIMVLAALAGGLLANRQDALGLAFVSTLGGFMAPFLVDSHNNNIVALLSYISILDLAVLYLAYYRNWRILNALALVGTILVYITYSLVSGPAVSTGIREVYLFLFFLIFGSLTFLNNARQKLLSGAGELFILIMNAAFFFAASYDNLHAEYNSWLAWLAVGLALLYLLTSRWLIKNNPADRLLFLVFLGTGLAFLTIAVPLHFQWQWMATAWLVEAVVLVYAGYRTQIPLVHGSGLILLIVLALSTWVNAPGYGEALYYPLFNSHSLNSWLAIAGFILAAYTFFHPPRPSSFAQPLSWALAIGALLNGLNYVDWEVGNTLAYFHWGFSQNFSVSLIWVLAALFMFFGGLIGNARVFRYLSLGLFILTTFKVLFIDLSGMEMVFRIIILTIVGLILVAVSFAYQQKEKNNPKDELP